MKKILSFIMLTGLVSVSCFAGSDSEPDDPNIYNIDLKTPEILSCCCSLPFIKNIKKWLKNLPEDDSKYPYDHETIEYFWKKRKEDTDTNLKKIIVIQKKKKKE